MPSTTWHGYITGAVWHTLLFFITPSILFVTSRALTRFKLVLIRSMAHLIHEAINLQKAKVEKKEASKFNPRSPLCITHRGPLPCPAAPSHPAVAFIGKFLHRIDSLSTSEGPYHEWFAPAAKVYDTDGSVYDGGDVIWNELWRFLDQFEEVEDVVNMTTVIETVNDATRAYASDGTDRKAWLVMLDVDTRFWLKDELAGPVIVVPRMLHYLIGRREWGYGTDDLQILQAKSWWDPTRLKDDIRARQDKQVMVAKKEEK